MKKFRTIIFITALIIGSGITARHTTNAVAESGTGHDHSKCNTSIEECNKKHNHGNKHHTQKQPTHKAGESIPTTKGDKPPCCPADKHKEKKG